MKKIININLSGRVIPIEDAAYENLQHYIESLRRYFAHEEGRDEIINDIESRMAELMSDKIKKGATAVTEADMDEIIKSMGRVEDFEQAEGPEPGATTPGAGNEEPFIRFKTPRGRLYRDSNDKILGGVCSGIGHYLGLDPALIRILLVLLVFGAGSGIILYILLWIILPARPLPGINVKRLFRNPDDRILGGVAGGLGTYFGKEPWIIRLIFAAPLLLNILFAILNGLFFAFDRDVFPNFVIGSFTGTFILAYIILWIILPVAKSTYEKMEMRGEKVDVNRIKQNVQEGMSGFKSRMDEWGKEVKESAQNISTQAKEFAGDRGKSFAHEAGSALRPVARGAGNVLGLIFKVIFMAFAGFIALVLFIMVIAALSSGVIRPLNDFILDGSTQKFALWGTLVFFLGVPLIAIITWMVRRIMKLRSQNRYLGWTFGGLWALGWVCLVLFVSSMVKDFRIKEQSEATVPLSTSNMGKITVRIDEPPIRNSGTYGWISDNDNDGHWDITEDTLRLADVRIRVSKSTDSLFHVNLWKESHGENRREAAKRTDAFHYTVRSMDSALVLASGFSISKDQKYRGQKAIVSIEVPVGKKIRFDETVRKIRFNNVRIVNKRNWRNDNWEIDWDRDEYYDWEPGIDYTMTAEGKLMDPLNPNKETNSGNDDYKNSKDPDSGVNGADSENGRNPRIDKEIERQRKKIEKEQRKLEQLENKKDQGGSGVSFKEQVLDLTERSIHIIQSPVFSLI